jgi:Arc/MetJ family transcription regulator
MILRKNHKYISLLLRKLRAQISTKFSALINETGTLENPKYNGIERCPKSETPPGPIAALAAAFNVSMCIMSANRTHGLAMRTNIEIDDELIREALRVSGLKTKRAAVEAGLKALIRLSRQKKILDLAGKVHWEGNLDESREGRFPP